MNKNTINPVNAALQLPLADAFEADLTDALVQAEDIQPIALAMLDLDGLHAVNTTYGKEAGDKILIETGRHLIQNLPPKARLYRYAGDAFAILFPQGQEKEEAFLLLEALRRSYSLTQPDGSPATITIGLSCSPEDSTQYTELVRKAEGAMFRGKISGRNKVCLAREEKMVTKTSHYTTEQLQRLTKLSKREGIGEAILLREALDGLLKRYDV